ncbi:hypothetical protein B0A49_13658 [Cryomyces minteri]|uniref:HNH nuclease domain-containing protein n=1 Tax=Cryomyces minteri TaxID=331657 RepID=A0A4U0V8H5_9PEZI|nr:hypothetical protein B0A49_13658 [Cryomyces minteri]
MVEPPAGQTTQTPVVPPPHVFEPPPISAPPRSSTSSGRSSRKRPRSSINDDASVGTPASVAFSETVKRNVTQLLGNFCWHCGATPVQVCHVIPKKNGSFLELKRNSLITFEHLGSEQNAIALCGTCHANFDNTNQPGFVFLPTNLRYFIEFEKTDFSYREERARRCGGIIDKRAVPTAAAYLQQQIKDGAVELDAIGGLYQSYTLRNYFPTFITQENYAFIPGPGPFKPGEWHGDPMAAIWRGFRILGDLLNKIPEEEENLLWELRRLYQREVKLQGDSAGTSVGAAGDGNNGAGQGQGDDTSGHNVEGSDRPAQPPAPSGDMPPPSGRPLRPRPARRTSGNDATADEGTGGGSSTDSAIDVSSGTSKSKRKRKSESLTDPDTHHSGPPSKRRITRSDHYPQPQSSGRSRPPDLPQPSSHDIPDKPAQHTPTHPHLIPRPRRQPQWMWGPESSSSQKVREYSASLGIYGGYDD